MSELFKTSSYVGTLSGLRLMNFDVWLKELAEKGNLDIVSIGSSQLTQEKFGEDWEGLPNGGGAPINSEIEFRNVRDSARQMLVRAYSGTNNVPEYSEMLDRTINCCWHALSLFWFAGACALSSFALDSAFVFSAFAF